MRRIACIFVLSLFAVAPAAVSQNQSAEEVSTKSGDVPRMSKSQVIDAYGKLPLSFEVNEGQSPSEAKFLARGLGYQLLLTQDGAVLALLGPRQDGMEKQTPSASSLLLPEAKELLQQTAKPSSAPASVVYMQVLGANPAAKIVGADELPGKSNYFIGNDPKKWRPNLSTFAKVKYPGIYPGVDLVYYGNQGQLEYDFVVAPGASLKQVRLAIAGEEVTSGHQRHKSIPMHIDANGDLVAMSANGEMRWQKPVAYQIGADGSKQLVSARFIRKSKQEVGFAVGSHDVSKVLVIDPTLVYSTYVAGATNGPYYFGYTGDQAAAIAVDSNGSAYITGLTESADFPITSGAYQKACKPLYGPGCLVSGTSRGAETAVFVTKLSPDGSSLVYSTYLGGSYDDNGTGIAVDSSGNAYISGQTLSPDFPVTKGAYQTICGPRLDIVNGAYCYGSHIVSTCGPPGHGTPDGFVTKLNSTGSSLVYSTFLGGSLNDYLTGIAVNAAGEAYVSGITLSSYSYSRPGSCGCPPQNPGCDTNSNASASYGYPITPNAYFPGALPAPPSGYISWPFGSPSAFTGASNSVTGYPFGSNRTPVFSKLSADGSTLLYSTYIGGGFGPAFPSSSTLGDGQTFYPYLQQNATGVAVDSAGNGYLTGYSNASDLCCKNLNPNAYNYSGFPTTPGVVQPHNASACAASNCAYDAFVAKFDPTQSGAASLVYSTNLGGQGDDYANAIAVDSGGNAYVTGTANLTGYNAAPTFPTTAGTIQPNCPGNCSRNYGWVVKLNSTATALDYSTYLSGTSANNTPQAIAVDSQGNAYVAGQTSSTDFPQQNALQGYAGGALTSAFASVLNPTASTLLFSTYLGSDNINVYANNGIAGVALDSSNNIYVTGSTTSSRFPTTSGAFQTSCPKCASGSWGVFASKISEVTPVGQSPLITSTNAATFQVGVAGSFTVTTTGTPTPQLTESVTLPSGLTFTDNGNGTGTLSGTPAPGTAGNYALAFTASNGVNPSATQNFTLTVSPAGQAPLITSSNAATFQVGVAGSFTVTTTGTPTPALSESGTPPNGVTFTDNRNGTGTLSGTPAAGTGGNYVLAFTASNGVTPSATQTFTLTVNQAAAITSTNSATFVAASAGSFTVSATGFPTPTLSQSGTLPAGVGFNASTGVLSGTPAAGTGGLYNISFMASNGVGAAAVQNFTLVVQDFSLSAIPTITVPLGGSAPATVTVNPIQGYSAAVSLSATGLPAGASAAFSTTPITPTNGNAVSSTMTVNVSPALTPHTFTFSVTGTYGALSHSTTATVTIIGTASGLSNVIAALLSAGGITDPGIANALTSKVSAAQSAISSGNAQTAINISGAFENQVNAQAGKHIATSLTLGGITFNPANLLLIDAQSLIDSLRTGSLADPVIGYVVNSSGVGIAGATVSVLGPGGNIVATATTDITGFYYFATTGVFASGSSYSVQVTGVPAGYVSSNPASQQFPWQGVGITLGSFALK